MEELREIHSGICDSLDRVIEKAGAIDDSETETETDDEESFQIDFFIASWQDKLKSVFENPYFTTYLRINNAKACLRTKISSITLEFGSNCCLMVCIDFSPIVRPTKKMLQNSSMKICRRDNDTGSTCHLMDIEHRVEDDLRSLVFTMHDKKQKINVSFDIVSELDVSDTSMMFRIGYLEYDIN